ncbi:MAG: indole-3-glycerol phosphate synthase TrpC [Piscirickettsiaceae bacterium]|nr:indole-3-glycerol phosphate synthase TrpC [Piscirickettsiaceae bacterium]
MVKKTDILKIIIKNKAEEITERRKNITLRQIIELAEVASPVRGFIDAIETKINVGDSAVIAEIKKASPSKGLLRKDFVPADIAKSYEEYGASCLSIVTDNKFFQGDELHIKEVRGVSSLPILRKDFIIDPYQVYETRAIDADCILLIASILHDEQLCHFSNLAMQLGMDVLVEVHNIAELERTLLLNLPLIGINNRDLDTFEINLDTTLNLLNCISNSYTVITESGINSSSDVALMKENKVNAFLVGEAFICAVDPGVQLGKLFNFSTI